MVHQIRHFTVKHTTQCTLSFELSAFDPEPQCGQSARKLKPDGFCNEEEQLGERGHLSEEEGDERETFFDDEGVVTADYQFGD